ncbi:hypothetical protein O0L34_g18726 [Tuta absoluta]|nr:hypothetical protein O0L34_g18726 [Tuta absoluta]
MRMYYTLNILMTTLGLACSRETTSKVFRDMPAISNSLVNFGKMDISFHFNDKNPDSWTKEKLEQVTHSITPFWLPKAEPVQASAEVEHLEPCPCSNTKNKNPFLRHNMLGDIVTGRRGSLNQEPFESVTCCESHEHVREDTVFIDSIPKNHAENPLQSVVSTFMLDSLIPKMQAPSFAPAGPAFKPKTIEILFFPKQNKEPLFDFSKSLPSKDKKPEINVRSDIQIVGDKELKNEFKNLKFRPTFSLLPFEKFKKEAGFLPYQKIKKNAEEKKEMKSEKNSEEKPKILKEKENGVSVKTTPPPFTPTTKEQ